MEIKLIGTLFLVVLCYIGMIFVIYILYRSQRVFSYRKKVLEDKNITVTERNKRHRMLPSYDKMVWQLGKFNWDDYLKE